MRRGCQKPYMEPRKRPIYESEDSHDVATPSKQRHTDHVSFPETIHDLTNPETIPDLTNPGPSRERHQYGQSTGTSDVLDNRPTVSNRDSGRRPTVSNRDSGRRPIVSYRDIDNPETDEAERDHEALDAWCHSSQPADLREILTVCRTDTKHEDAWCHSSQPADLREILTVCRTDTKHEDAWCHSSKPADLRKILTVCCTDTKHEDAWCHSSQPADLREILTVCRTDTKPDQAVSVCSDLRHTLPPRGQGQRPGEVATSNSNRTISDDNLKLATKDNYGREFREHNGGRQFRDDYSKEIRDYNSARDVRDSYSKEFREHSGGRELREHSGGREFRDYYSTETKDDYMKKVRQRNSRELSDILDNTNRKITEESTTSSNNEESKMNTKQIGKDNKESMKDDREFSDDIQFRENSADKGCESDVGDTQPDVLHRGRDSRDRGDRSQGRHFPANDRNEKGLASGAFHEEDTRRAAENSDGMSSMNSERRNRSRSRDGAYDTRHHWRGGDRNRGQRARDHTGQQAPPMCRERIRDTMSSNLVHPESPDDAEPKHRRNPVRGVIDFTSFIRRIREDFINHSADDANGICVFMAQNVDHVARLTQDVRDRDTSDRFIELLRTALVESESCVIRSQIMEALTNSRFFESRLVNDMVKSLVPTRDRTPDEDDVRPMNHVLDILKVVTRYRQMPHEDVTFFLNILIGVLCQAAPAGAVQVTSFTDAKQTLVDSVNTIEEHIQEAERINAQRGDLETDRAPSTDQDLPAIIPKVKDIHENRNVQISHRKALDVFSTASEYVRYTFLVFRQDFIGPLCKAIQRYREFVRNADTQSRTGNQVRSNLSQRFKNQSVRLYDKVEVVDTTLSGDTDVGVMIKIDPSRIKSFNSRLKFGSLVCLSDNNFKSVIFATVKNKDDKQLKEEGLLTVHVVRQENGDFEEFGEISQEGSQFGREEEEMEEGEIDEDTVGGARQQADDVRRRTPDVEALRGRTFTMLESTAFYTSYRHPLEALDVMHRKLAVRQSSLPFKKQLLELSNNLATPRYLEASNGLMSFECMKKYVTTSNIGNKGRGSILGTDFQDAHYTAVNVQKPESWPSAEELGLDNSQYAALQQALTKELALIQGPPGTGKTTIGVRIAEVLLENQDLWRKNDMLEPTPLLLISYTNHALDQFLAELLDLPVMRYAESEDVVRVGSRSEHEEFACHNLSNLRKAFVRRCGFSCKYDKNRLHSFREHREQIDSAINMYAQGIVKENILRKEKVILEKHYQSLQSGQPTNDIEIIYVWLQLVMENCGERSEGRTYFEQGQSSTNSYTQQTQDYYREVVRNDVMTELEESNVTDVWQLDVTQRWRLYRLWRSRFIAKLRKQRQEEENEFQKVSDRVVEQQNLHDKSIMQRAKIVAMTTTTASRLTSILGSIGPRIVIVEEAAQVSEAHLLSSLTSSCEHLILIGDHQQLRPSYNDYSLTEHRGKHHVDISLFERLCRGGVPYRRLDLQHRMRPEISSLLVPTIYSHLTDHSSVLNYRQVPGVTSSVFFLDHQQQEDTPEDSKSKRNTHEACFLAALYRYLRLQGYGEEDITILATYKAQEVLLRKLIKKVETADPLIPKTKDDDPPTCSYRGKASSVPKHRGARVTAVDNFQGEENKVILLSLVRSNKEGNIGFLREKNRVCVALSRAKEGLFVIGNLRMLAEHSSDCWNPILEAARGKQHLGSALRLRCPRHMDTFADVSCADDFQQLCPNGGCSLRCDFRRPECGHACDQLCHDEKLIHGDPCTKKCARRCDLGHAFKDHPCGDQCPPCREKVEMKMEPCGHMVEVECRQRERPPPCKVQCEKSLACGHRCQARCGDPCTAQCKELVKATAVCGHDFQIACWAKDSEDCTVPCSAALECGHPCTGKCGQCFAGRLHQPCRKKCGRTLVCGHTCKEYCTQTCPPCVQPCRAKCVHSKCRAQCGDECTPCAENCSWACKSICKNKYRCTKRCSEVCDRPRCDAPCKAKHSCRKCKKFYRCRGLLCAEECPDACPQCDADTFTIYLFGTEDEPDARFYKMTDCPCVLEVSGLDHYMDMGQDENSVADKKCPKCSSPILTSLRYGNALKSTYADVSQIKRKLLPAAGALTAKRSELILKIARSSMSTRLEDADLDILRAAESAKTLDQLAKLENQLSFLTAITDLRNTLKHQLDGESCPTRISRDLHKLKTWTMLKERRRNFSDRECEEFQRELRRGELAVMLTIAFTKMKTNGEYGTTAYQDTEKWLDRLMKKPDVLSPEEEADMRRSSGVQTAERVIIVKAMGFKQGHWYKCPNGHVYAIGECGGAMERSTCPECQADIGGSNHALTEGNAVATEMDGATHGAWSDQANLANFEHLE